MTTSVLLNNVDHQDLRVITRHGPEFGDAVNQVLILPTEYEEIQREYPILFRKDPDGEYQSVALLGLDRDENLFLEGDRWRASYVPAVRRRGPFRIGLQERSEGGEIRREPVIHVDLDHPQISRTEGEPLFLPQGGNAPYLDRVAEILRIIHTGLEVMGPMFEAFESFDLLRAVQIEIALDDDAKYLLPDFLTIDEARLAGLDGAALQELHERGFLRAAFLAAASLGNVDRLIARKNRRIAGLPVDG